LRVSIGFNADLPVPSLVAFARLAETTGFEGVWMHEHSFGRDSISNLSAIASSTEKLRLGFGCLSPYVRNPVVLALTAATLQEASNGRVSLGLGTGFPARLDLMGIEHQYPIAQLKDTIEIARKIWSGVPVTYAGKSSNLKNVKSLLGPVSKIPIYIAGWKTQMLRLTAMYADGYLAKGGESTNSIGQIVSAISSSTGSRSVKEIDLAAYLLTSVARSKDEALSKAKKDPFVAYMLSVQDDYLYEGTGIDPALKKPIAENYFKGNISGAFAAIKDEMIEAFTLSGTPEQVCERVAQYEKAGLNLPVLQPISLKAEDVQEVIRTGGMLIGSN
jgi:5,10-methylenetetrahydromethanopterin reductase